MYRRNILALLRICSLLLKPRKLSVSFFFLYSRDGDVNDPDTKEPARGEIQEESLQLAIGWLSFNKKIYTQKQSFEKAILAPPTG